MLPSPFHFSQPNGYIAVPVETFEEITDVLTELAVAKDARARDLAAVPIAQDQA